MRQSELEAEMQELGRSRYWKKVQRTTEGGMESQHALGKRLLTESVALLAEQIRLWKKQVEKQPVGNRNGCYPYIDMLDPQIAAALTARTVIDSISMHERLTKASFKVARVLEDEVKWREMKDQHPDLWKLQKDHLKKIPGYENKRRFLRNTEKFIELQFSKWPKNIRLKIGMTLVELMRVSTGIIDITTRRGLLGKSETYVHATDELQAWMKEAHKYAEDLSPMYLPMVERPADWTDVYNGGYLTESVHPRPLVKTNDRNHLEFLNNADISQPMAAVNQLQRVAWGINENVINTLLYCWESEIEIGDIPSPVGQKIPSKPHDIGENEDARRKWRKAAARIHAENTSNESKRLQMVKIFWMAKKFLGIPIFFPWYMDFRGRKYTRVYFLQPQGSKVARGALQAGHGMPIGSDDGPRWLAIHGANVFGEDKCTLDERVQWVHSNRDMITTVAEDPQGTTSLWGRASEPELFLAFCFEWAGFLKEGSQFITRLPISIDGSCNGLQLDSLLMRDPVGALATTVLPTPRPEDIYQDVANATIRRLEEDGSEMARKWLAFGITRATTKRSCMVVPYSGTLWACRDYVREWFLDEVKKRGGVNPFGWEETFKPPHFLAGKVWDSISDVVGEAQKAMSWYREVAKLCIDNEVPLRWTTPSGFVVKQAYETWQSQSVKTVIGDVIRQHKIRSGTGKLCKRRACNGVAPNQIHSIDAAICDLTVLKNSSQGMQFQSSIHDAYLCLAPDMPRMRDNLLDSVVQVFSGNLMEDFFHEIRHYLPTEVTVPEPPERGELDIELVRQSEYFYA